MLEKEMLRQFLSRDGTIGHAPRPSHCSERDHDGIAAEPVHQAAPGLACEPGQAVEASPKPTCGLSHVTSKSVQVQLLTRHEASQANEEKILSTSATQTEPQVVSSGLSLRKADAVLEAIASQDTSDLDLSDDELTETTLQEPLPDLSSSDDSDEESDSKPATSVGKLPPWRHAKFVSSLPAAPLTPDTNPDSHTNWTAPDYFKQYFPEDIYRTFHEMTEAGYHQRKGASLNTSAAEMKHFIGATFLMSCLGYPQIHLYWARQTRVAAIADVITRDRFFLLRRNIKVVNDLHISDAEKKADRLWRLRPFIEMIRTACLQLPRSPSASIDERIIPFTGRTTLKQYVPGKPHPTGLKNFVLSSPSGMVLDFEIYRGKSALATNTSELGVGACAVLRLAKSMPRGSALYFDRFFTAVPLLRHLSSQGLRATGIIMKNRVPKDCKLLDDKALVKKGQGSFCQTVNVADGICLVKWVDNKPITYASSHIGKDPVGECKRWCKKEGVYKDVPRPAIVEEYNKNMRGADLCDRMVSLYPSKARTTRWTVRALSFLADVAVVNAWLQYKDDCELLQVPRKNILSQLDFKLLLAHHLLRAESKVDDDDELPVKRPVNKRTPLPPVPFRTAGARHMPELSSQKSASRCRNPGCTERTKFRCTHCDVFLCITASRNCYKQFHK
ncbi:piggyBac transposable element-derived protein 3 isoform X1 [Rhipicephalus sanguineus]|uniref:piggyBac transposable element-derived protein 3 isoform X1 n=1 Tax=Rhipicephalus sanguineus TaxID=34632 RepID=UPI001892F5BD|nr:piggyBac transposable element-derived protein 3 isoform X1 [Rhipicephalus sanguineus]